jgi:hypothetical protein
LAPKALAPPPKALVMPPNPVPNACLFSITHEPCKEASQAKHATT